MFCGKSRNILMTFVVETRADVYTDTKNLLCVFGCWKVSTCFWVGKCSENERKSENFRVFINRQKKRLMRFWWRQKLRATRLINSIKHFCHEQTGWSVISQLMETDRLHSVLNRKKTSFKCWIFLWDCKKLTRDPQRNGSTESLLCLLSFFCC